MATKKIRYVGPLAAVDITDPDTGEVITAERNHLTPEIPVGLARSLLESDEWEKHDPPATAKKESGDAER